MDVLKSSDGLRVAFGITAVALVLAIYEIILFYYVIVPTVSQKVESEIKKVPKEIKNILKRVNVPKSDSESRNKRTVYVSITLIGFLVFVLYLLWSTLSKRHQGVSSTFPSIALTLLFIGIFQYSFYQYGQVYNYEDSDELLESMLSVL